MSDEGGHGYEYIMSETYRLSGKNAKYAKLMATSRFYLKASEDSS